MAPRALDGMKRFAFWAGLVAAVGTCASPSTEVVLRVSTDLPEGDCEGLSAVLVTVSSDAATSVVSRTFEVGAANPGALFLPQELGLVPDGDPSARLTVDVTARGPDGDLFTRRARVSYTEGRTTRLDVFLAARCRSVDARRCPTGTTCGASGCEPEVREGLPEYRSTPAEVLSAPRLLGPSSLGVLSSARATLRWAAPARGGASRVELCADRACARPLRAPIETPGHCVRTTRADLTSGTVFWRVTSIATGLTSAPWAMFVGARDAIVASVARTRLDLDGDGAAELVLASTAGGALRVFRGPRDAMTARALGADSDDGRVASAGDLDGDGFADLVVASPERDAPSDVRVDVVMGAPEGATSRRFSLAAPFEGAFLESPSERLSVRGAGDVDGDGFADVIVGAPHARRVFVFHGSAEMPSRVTTLAPPPELRAFGAVASGAGDVDGDGYDDVLVGALDADLRARRLFVVPGGFEGPSIARRVELLTGVAGVGFGARAEVRAAGDLNRDGSGDLVVWDGNAAVYLGPSYLGGSLTPQHVVRARASAGVTFTGASEAGDLDGDGYDDLVFTVLDATGLARLFVEYGRATPGAREIPEARIFTVDLSLDGAWSVVGVGDLDGDRRDDLVALDAEANGHDVRVFYGDASGLVEGLSLAVEGGASAAR